MTENPEASVLTATRAAQHFRLFRANDAYEHLCILTLLPSLAPLHLMLADTPWPHGFGATLTNVGPLSEGFERSVASPLQPRRLRAMGRTVRSISSLSDNHSNSFQVAVRIARHTTVRTSLITPYDWDVGSPGLLAGVRDSYHGVRGFRYADPRGTAYSHSVCLSRSGRRLSRDVSESHHWNQDTTWLWAKDFFFRYGAARRAASARDTHLVVISNACWHPPILA